MTSTSTGPNLQINLTKPNNNITAHNMSAFWRDCGTCEMNKLSNRTRPNQSGHVGRHVGRGLSLVARQGCGVLLILRPNKPSDPPNSTTEQALRFSVSGNLDWEVSDMNSHVNTEYMYLYISEMQARCLMPFSRHHESIRSFFPPPTFFSPCGYTPLDGHPACCFSWPAARPPFPNGGA
jgi:hypothetical protein